jgi:hypothetical protein
VVGAGRSYLPLAGVDTAGTAHVGLDIGLGAVADPYNPCHRHADDRGEYSDPFYAACQDSNLYWVSYFKHWSFGPGGAGVAGQTILWGDTEFNRCRGREWCPPQPPLITTMWASKATTWALEFYPHRADEGGVRLQGTFHPDGRGSNAGPDLGVVHLPKLGDAGTVRLHGTVAGSPAPSRFQIDAFQRERVWLTTSTGHPEQGFASVTNAAGGAWTTGPLPAGGYHVVVTDNDTGEAYGYDADLGPREVIDLDPARPCFGLVPAYAPYTTVRRC